MVQAAEQFLQRIEVSPALQAQMTEADGDMGRMLAIASEVGFHLAPDALASACAARTEQLQESANPVVYYDHPIVYFS